MLCTGLWLLSRKPVDPEATAAMLKKAAELSLDTANLKSVTQEGCLYGAAAGSSSTSSGSSGSSSGSDSSVSVAATPAKQQQNKQGKAAAPTPDKKADSQKKVGVAAVTADDVLAALDPLSVTQKVELQLSIGGKPAGSVILGMFGNAAPKTVQNVSDNSSNARVCVPPPPLPPSLSLSLSVMCMYACW